MKNKNDILYIFLHVPKTAGLTFRTHINGNFKKDEYVWLPIDLPNLNNDTFRYIDLRNYKKEVKKYIFNLQQKDKIKIIYGHMAFYGVHKFFNKTPRYITFVRNPVARTISYYNYILHLYKQRPKKIRKYILTNGKVPSFKQWLKQKYNDDQIYMSLQAGEMHHFFKKNGYGSTPKEILSKFYFVGITENFNEDALFLYHELGINKFFKDQNISTKYFSLPDGDDKTRQMILKKNVVDQKLYDYALEINKKFGKRKDFNNIVTRMKIKRNKFTEL